MLIAHCALSQTDSTQVKSKYPQVKIIEGDTIFLFTHDNVKEFEKTYTRLDGCNELKKSLETEILLCNAGISLCDEQVKVKNNRIELLTEINVEVDDQNNILTTENKKQSKKIKLLKKSRTLFTIGGTILGGVFGYLITK
tara:strand:+ start:898 stop:1317 length:420 start_codon:yes stop_codon:yes gene_type:complete